MKCMSILFDNNYQQLSSRVGAVFQFFETDKNDDDDQVQNICNKGIKNGIRHMWTRTKDIIK